MPRNRRQFFSVNIPHSRHPPVRPPVVFRPLDRRHAANLDYAGRDASGSTTGQFARRGDHRDQVDHYTRQGESRTSGVASASVRVRLEAARMHGPPVDRLIEINGVPRADSPFGLGNLDGSENGHR